MSERKDRGFFEGMDADELQAMTKSNLGTTGPAQAQETNPKLLYELPEYHSLVPLQHDYRPSQASQVRELPPHRLAVFGTQRVN